jgi:hypothetical protein
MDELNKQMESVSLPTFCHQAQLTLLILQQALVNYGQTPHGEGAFPH